MRSLLALLPASAPRWPLSQWVVRAAGALMPLVGLAAALPAGARPSTGAWLVVGLLALGGGIAPESLASVAAPAFVLAYWTLLVPEPLSAWLLVAGVALVGGHVLAGTGELGPGSLPLGREVAARWAPGGLLVLPALALTWLLAVTVDGASAPPGMWLAGAGASAAALLLAAVLLLRVQGPRRRPARRRVSYRARRPEVDGLTR